MVSSVWTHCALAHCNQLCSYYWESWGQPHFRFLACCMPGERHRKWDLQVCLRRGLALEHFWCHYCSPATWPALEQMHAARGRTSDISRVRTPIYCTYIILITYTYITLYYEIIWHMEYIYIHIVMFIIITHTRIYIYIWIHSIAVPVPMSAASEWCDRASQSFSLSLMLSFKVSSRNWH